MEEKIYRIKMLAVPGNGHAPPIEEGYYGPVAGVSMNRPIYCRVTRDRAWVYTRNEAIRTVLGMRGWRCQCEPSITLTL